MGATAKIPLDLQIMRLLYEIAWENAASADLKTGTYFDYTSVIGNLSYAYSLISNEFYPAEIYRVKQMGCQDIRAAMEVSKILTFFARYLVEQYRGEHIALAAVYAVENAKRVIDDTARCPRPASLPAGVPWCERMSTGCDDERGFDPYAYDGSMTVEDYEAAQAAFFKDRNTKEARI